MAIDRDSIEGNYEVSNDIYSVNNALGNKLLESGGNTYQYREVNIKLGIPYQKFLNHNMAYYEQKTATHIGTLSPH